MARGIVATLKKAMLDAGIPADQVDLMLGNRRGSVTLVLDSIDDLIKAIALKTKEALDCKKAASPDTVAEIIQKLSGLKKKSVSLPRGDPEVVYLYCIKRRTFKAPTAARLQPCLLRRVSTPIPSRVDTRGLDLLAEAASLVQAPEVQGMTERFPILAGELSTTHTLPEVKTVMLPDTPKC